MQMKKVTSLALALSLTAGLAVPALAAENDLVLISANPATAIAVDLNAYASTITVNGKALDLTGIPAAEAGLLPLRAIAEADGSGASWYEEDNESYFFLTDATVGVNYADMSITVDFEPQEAKAVLNPAGYTYVPASVLSSIAGYTVTEENGNYTITTPSADPMRILPNNIAVSYAPAAATFAKKDDILAVHTLEDGNFESLAGMLPFMISADTVIIGKVAEGKTEEAKADLEAIKADTVRSFEHYLEEPYQMALKGEVVTYNGYAMLIISDDNASAIEMFKAGIDAIAAGETIEAIVVEYNDDTDYVEDEEYIELPDELLAQEGVANFEMDIADDVFLPDMAVVID